MISDTRAVPYADVAHGASTWSWLRGLPRRQAEESVEESAVARARRII